jgi:hypothetical protein
MSTKVCDKCKNVFYVEKKKRKRGVRSKVCPECKKGGLNYKKNEKV